jgi:hypothetical protein
MKEFDLTPGKQIGYILSKLFDAVLDDPAINKKEILLEFARENNLWVQS